MAVAAKDVQELRARTNVGMMDCKKALEEADGDMDKAIELLRTRGIAKAEGRSGRVAKEGVIASFVTADGRTGVLLEVNSETDFVARTAEFQDFVNATTQHLATASADSVEDLLGQAHASGKSVQDMLSELIAQCGENVTVRRFDRYDLEADGLVATYIHTGSKLGVMVELTGPVSEAVPSFAKDVSMHIAASAPVAVSREDVDQVRVERERGIFKEQALGEGKPEKVIDRIVEGRIEKYFQEVCLLEQPFVKDPDRTVKGMVADLEGVQIRRFVRFVLGEES
jgi:elongation factor Ts